MNISYVIPMFNAEDTITEAVESIFDDNYMTGDEVIIVNDGSTDGSLVVANNLKDEFDGKIIIVDLGVNKGNETARNEGVSRATNPYIFNLDADNVLLKDSINSLKMYCDEKDLDAAAFRDMYYFKKTTSKVTHMWVFREGLVNLEDCLCGGVVPISSGNYLYKKSVWESVGGYTVGAKALDAWFFGFETIALGYKLGVMSRGGYSHRHGHSSLWVRDAKKNIISSLAKELVLKHQALLNKDDLAYLRGEGGSNSNWFENMARKPIRTIANRTGKNGKIIMSRPWKRLKILENTR